MPSLFPERHPLRLSTWDYSQSGAYFVTLCARNRACIFGDVLDGKIRLSSIGQLVHDCWKRITAHSAGVSLDAFVVMPNHVHGILVLGGAELEEDDGRARKASPLRRSEDATAKLEAPPEFRQRVAGVAAGSLAAVVGGFKSAVSRGTAKAGIEPGPGLWQRGYYDRVIRGEAELNRIREYILANPLRWALDRENPVADGRDPFEEWLANTR